MEKEIKMGNSNVAELYRQLRYARTISQTMIIHLMDAATGLTDSDKEPAAPAEPESHSFDGAATNTYLPEDEPMPEPELPDTKPVNPELMPDTEPLPDTEPVTEPATEPEPEQPVHDPNKAATRDDIRNALRPLVAKSRSKAKEILEKYGAGNITELKEEHFPVVLVEINNALTA